MRMVWIAEIYITPRKPAIIPLGKFVKPESVCGGSLQVKLGNSSAKSSALTSSVKLAAEAAISLTNKNVPETERYIRRCETT